MKLSTIATTALITLASSYTFANDVVFKATDDSIASQACVAAATGGLRAVKDLVIENNINYNDFRSRVSCNSMSLTRFARTYASQNIVSESEEAKAPEFVRLVAKTQAVESQLCVDAAVMGEQAARAKHNVLDRVTCNGKVLSRFVKTLEDKEVELVLTED